MVFRGKLLILTRCERKSSTLGPYFEAKLFVLIQESWFYLPLWAPKSVAKKANTWQKKPTHGKKSQCLANKNLELKNRADVD